MVFGLLRPSVWMLLPDFATLSSAGKGPHLQKIHLLVRTILSAMFLSDAEGMPSTLSSV